MESRRCYIFCVCVCSLSHPACKVHVPCYIVIWDLSGSTILPHYFITGTLLDKNLTELRFMNEEMKPLNLDFQYSIEKPLAAYFTNLVTETDNAIELLDAKMHNTYCISATKKLKQILNSNNSYNILHRRQLYIIKQLKQACNKKCSTCPSC